MTSIQNWAGERLGLPQSGSGSLAKVPRRVAAISIDWAIAYLLASAFFGADSTAMTLIFGLMQWLLVATIGASFGHLALKMRVRRLDGQWVGFWRSLIRVGMILLVIPAVIWDADNRGLHDKAAGTVLLLK